MSKSTAGAKGTPRSKRRFLVLLLLPIGVLAGTKLTGGGDSKPSSSSTASPTTTIDPHGATESLNPITLNLADGRLLRIGVTLEAPPSDPAEAAIPEEEPAEGAEPAGEDPTKGFARAADIVITTMGKYRMPDLLKPDIRSAAKVELLEAMRSAYGDEVNKVYFYEFTMQ